MLIFFDRGITVSLALTNFSSSGLILVSPVLGAAPWPPFFYGPGTGRGVASSTSCSHGPKLGPSRERGWLPPQLLWCACQGSAPPEGLLLLASGSLFHRQGQASEVKLCRNSGKTDQVKELLWLINLCVFSEKEKIFFFFTLAPYK